MSDTTGGFRFPWEDDEPEAPASQQPAAAQPPVAPQPAATPQPPVTPMQPVGQPQAPQQAFPQPTGQVPPQQYTPQPPAAQQYPTGQAYPANQTYPAGQEYPGQPSPLGQIPPQQYSSLAYPSQTQQPPSPGQQQPTNQQQPTGQQLPSGQFSGQQYPTTEPAAASPLGGTGPTFPPASTSAPLPLEEPPAEVAPTGGFGALDDLFPPTQATIAPASAPSPSSPEPAPTVASAVYDPDATRAYGVVPSPASADVPTQAFASPAAAVGAEATEANELDSLFGDASFQEYEEKLIPSLPASAGGGPGGGKVAKGVIWSGVGVVAALVLIVLFLVGTKIPEWTRPAPTETETAAPSEGPLPPGEYEWSELLGGECLEPYAGAWSASYTVVDCAQPHGGQLLHRAEYDYLSGAVSEADMIARFEEFCPPTLLDYTVASAYSDVVVAPAFPVSQLQAEQGFSYYYCFVSLESGAEITGSLLAVAAEEPVDEESSTETPTEEGTD